MKIVVIGGHGRIGSKIVEKLGEHGHDAVAADPGTGVITITGEGLAEALEGANVVIDVSNSPSFEDDAVMEFFLTSTRNLLTAEQAARVGHHVALSVVGCDRLPDSGYLRAKLAQEELIEASSIPYTIVRSTQFLSRRVDLRGRHRGRHRSRAVGEHPARRGRRRCPRRGQDRRGHAREGIVEVAGPKPYRFDELIRHGLSAHDDPRRWSPTPTRSYFGDHADRRQPAAGRERPARRDPVRGLAPRSRVRRLTSTAAAPPDRRRGRGSTIPPHGAATRGGRDQRPLSRRRLS